MGDKYIWSSHTGTDELLKVLLTAKRLTFIQFNSGYRLALKNKQKTLNP